MTFVFSVHLKESWPFKPPRTQEFEVYTKSVANGSRKGTILKYFANPEIISNRNVFSQITVEKIDKSKQLLQILRKLVNPQITFSIIRKYFAIP